MSITRETLRQLVDVVDDKDIGLVCQILIRFVQEDDALPDEIEVIRKADFSISKYGAVDYADIDWD